MASSARHLSQRSPDATPRIVVTADDFGRCAAINEAVAIAHREGILTSASLMVTGDAVDDAVAAARRSPSLAVGLHLVVVDGTSALPPDQIRSLVDRNRRFRRCPLQAGVHYFFSQRARQQLRREIEAQFERFAATGLPLSHVDGHLHMHLHPTILQIVLPLAQRYGAHGLRIPRDCYWSAVRHNRQHLFQRTCWSGAFSLLSRLCVNRTRSVPLVVPSRTYGLMQSGSMQQRYVVDVLRKLREPSAEIYFHPTVGPRLDPWGPNCGDLETLTSSAVRSAIDQRGLRLSTYADLRQLT